MSLFFFVSLWTLTSSWSIHTQTKEEFDQYPVVLTSCLVNICIYPIHIIAIQVATRASMLKGHSQLYDCADLDTSFPTLKKVHLNLKSKLRVEYFSKSASASALESLRFLDLAEKSVRREPL